MKPISCSPSSKAASVTSPLSVPTTITTTPLTTATNSSTTICPVVDDSANYAQLGTALSNISQSLSKASDFMAAKTLAASISQATLQSAIVSASELLSRPNIQMLLENVPEPQQSSFFPFPPISSKDAESRSIKLPNESLTRDGRVTGFEISAPRHDPIDFSAQINLDNFGDKVEQVNIEDGATKINQLSPKDPIDGNCLTNLSQSEKDSKEGAVPKKLKFLGEKYRLDGSDEVETDQHSPKAKELNKRRTLRDPENYEDIYEKNEMEGALASESPEDEDILPPRPCLPEGALMSLASIYAQMASEGRSQNFRSGYVPIETEESEALSPFPPRPEPPLSDSDEDKDEDEDEDEDRLPSFSPSFVRVSSPEEYVYVVSTSEELERENSPPQETSGYSRRPLPTILEMSSSSSASPDESLGTSGEVSPSERNNLSAQLLQLLASSSLNQLCSNSNPKVEVEASPLSTTSPSSLPSFCHSTSLSARDLLNSNVPQLMEVDSHDHNESVLDRPVVGFSEAAAISEDDGRRGITQHMIPDTGISYKFLILRQ